MKKLALVLVLALMFAGCGNNPIQPVKSKTDKMVSNPTITIISNRGTETFEYLKLTYINNYLDITIYNEYANQDVYYEKDSINYYETFK